MKKCKSKIVAVLAAVLTLSSVCATTAFADCIDKPWSTSNEYIRHKDNSSSVYVYNQGTVPVSVSIYGEGSANGRGYLDVSSYPGYSRHRTTSLTIPSGTQGSIRQFIHEKGYSYAHLCVGNVYGPSSGVWSPDSTKDYSVVN